MLLPPPEQDPVRVESLLDRVLQPVGTLAGWGSRLVAGAIGIGASAGLLVGMWSSSISIAHGIEFELLTLFFWVFALVGWERFRAAFGGSPDQSRTASSSSAFARLVLFLTGVFAVAGLFAIAKPLTYAPALLTPATLILETLYIVCVVSAWRARDPKKGEAFLHAALATITASAWRYAYDNRPLTYAENNELVTLWLASVFGFFRVVKIWRAARREAGRAAAARLTGD